MSGRFWSFIKRKRDRTVQEGQQPPKTDSKIEEEEEEGKSHGLFTPTLVFTQDNDETQVHSIEERDVATSKVITPNHNVQESSSQSLPSTLQVIEESHTTNRHSRNQHLLDLKRQTTSTSLHDGVSSEDRPRLGSDVSAASSYHTCKSSRSSLHHSPTNNRTKEGIFLSAVMKGELQITMREVLDKRMTELESKIDASQQRLESRVGEIEKILQIHNETPEISAFIDEEKRIELPTNLPVLTEDSEEDVNDNTFTSEASAITYASLQPGHCSKNPPKARRYTDFEAVKLTRNREVINRRQEYAKNKSMSLQYSQLPRKSCDQKVVVWLTLRVTNWKFLARWLGLQESEVSRIEIDNPNNDREQCYQMFLKWKAVDPDNYTYSVLGEALRKESRELYNDYVKEVHRIENNITFE